MNRLVFIFFITFTPINTVFAEECTKLIDVIGIAAQNNGIVFPLDREQAVILHYLRIIPFEIINSDAKYYIEDRGEPLVKLFTMRNGCAGLQWMIPKDFLLLIGIRRTST